MEAELNKPKHQRAIGFIFVVLGTFSLVVSIIVFNMYFLGSYIFGSDLPSEVTLGSLKSITLFSFLLSFQYFMASLDYLTY
ncbi:MAG: hypothetical protein O2887_01080 [Bacteroidetes bacterium]|nr:hypothetical protein [Bacteroidota bacterium]MDA1119082.1 hypothetical protein [Bacteroidota bacterium]